MLHNPSATTSMTTVTLLGAQEKDRSGGAKELRVQGPVFWLMLAPSGCALLRGPFRQISLYQNVHRTIAMCHDLLHFLCAPYASSGLSCSALPTPR
ncbi:hypothetical protein SBA4_4410009 [Candidatus Sulfopaludibacter sp. SbA4]|nr:hypothetical protein SBA4_4410009 [Candidatus Sulfopaludibacter sp. SbA4]